MDERRDIPARSMGEIVNHRRALRTPVALVALLSVCALLGGHLKPTPVHAAESWAVQVGGDSPDGLIEPIGFFPKNLSIHVGDTVTWTLAGFHTVTYDPGNALPPDTTPGPEPGAVSFGGAFFPIPQDGPPATFDGTQPVSSGTPQGDPSAAPPYTLTFSQTGRFTFFCAVHDGMKSEVDVLPADAQLSETPADATARGKAELEDVLGDAQNGVPTVQTQQLGSVHTVALGANFAGGVSALQMLPGAITVHKGDTVVWTNADPFEIHTVTFTSGGDLPSFTEDMPRFLPSGPVIVSPANVASPVGGTSYTGTGYLNSGILFPGNSFVLTIDAPPGTYTYNCLVHAPTMKGTITVLP